MRNRNILWGLVFIFAAAFILLSNFGYFEDINLASSLLTIFLFCCIFKSLRPVNFFGILMPIAVLIIIYDKQLHLEAITPFPVLFAAVSASIGLSFIFPNRPGIHFGGDVFCDKSEHINDPDINCTVTFGEASKYIDAPDFRQAYLKCSFGSLKVFFDHTQVNGDSAEIYVDNSFGETELYLPKDWNVKLEVSSAFGDVEEVHRTTNAGFPVVTVKGHVSFGECKIYYI